MSGRIRVTVLGSGARRIAYSDNKTFDVSSKMMTLIANAGGGEVDKTSPESDQDALISAVMAQISDDCRLRLELAVYGRGILEMHPRSLTNVTCGISREDSKPYAAISTQVGKRMQKLAGVR